ncbi:MAG TPA: PEP-CTERM sorting domain-containing protein [Candidatus Acidoferrales bacterium]|jgi:hypothetical protein|nr:PEP-CTERM sorting domain-containing protein [Candidatus Acidoferrales bacterium]
MKKARLYLMAVAAVFCALVLSPGVTRADELTGSAGIAWMADGTTYASDAIPVGSSLSCPGSSPVCTYFYGYGTEALSVGTSSITYTVSDFPAGDYTGTTNGFDFTGLTFASGDPLTGFTIVSNSMGLTASDITVGPSSIFFNLTGLPIDGTFTVDLISGPAVTTPEPSSLVMLGIGLLALMGLASKRFAAGRFAVESAS